MVIVKRAGAYRLVANDDYKRQKYLSVLSSKRRMQEVPEMRTNPKLYWQIYSYFSATVSIHGRLIEALERQTNATYIKDKIPSTEPSEVLGSSSDDTMNSEKLAS